MGELGDVLGDEFEEQYQSTREKRREQTRKVDQETLMKICYEAIHEGGFDGDEPRFIFDAGEVDHDVVLLESPEQDLQKFRHTFDSGGVSLGMFHLNDLWSCAFNEEMVELVDKIEPDTYYLVVGRYQEKTETKGDGTEETYTNISPVRGIVPLAKAKQMADKFEEQMSASSIEEQASNQQQQTEAETSESETTEDEGGIDMGGLDEEEEAGPSDEDIVRVLKHVADNNPNVIRQVADGDEDMLENLVGVVNNNVEGDAALDHVVEVFEAEVAEIDWPEEEEEEEMGGGIDLGGLDEEDEDLEEDTEEVEEQPEEEDEGSDTQETGGGLEETVDELEEGASGGSSEASGGDEEEEDVDDWF